MKYNFGKPPHIGWWCVVISKDKTYSLWRWWNGRQWSAITRNVDDETMVKFCSNIFIEQTNIFWCTYWPEAARVPRSVIM